MSTILKTAAMSLLSKTLQTFLYKYLSDVDVEGVALPSVYDGSGWGVRLSNVKLREGVQLMEQMPGKERKRRKRSKKKRKQKVTPPTVSRVGEQDKELEDMSLQQPSIHTDTHDFPDERPNQFQRGTEVYEEFQEISLHLNDMGHYHASRSRTNSYDDLRVPVDDEELTSPPSRPSTPLQDSKSIFSCFTKGRDKQHNNARTMPEIDAPDEGNDVTSKPPVSVVEESTMYRQVSALASDEKKEAGHMEGSARTGVTVEQDESDDEDDYEDYEQPYKLCLGDNGRIGTLDIRLVDRELHVLIEDALLTIEAFPVIEATHECDDNDGEEQVDERLKPTIDDAGSATTSGSAPLPSKPKTKTQKAEPKRETVGDRVLADNPLARVFAGIPRLFLRDIRIRLIIRKDPKVESTDKGGDKAADSATANQPGPGDTMLELGIEFLSVSGGEDVLSQFQDRSEDDSKNHEDQANGTQPIASVAAFSSVGIPVDNNEYMIRHIRTGRGPSAGIWIQVFAPCPKLPARVTRNGISWAKQQWELATNFHLLRCSGLDIQARIHLGPKKPASSYSWFYDEDSSAEYDYYDDYTLDTMFVGFDTIAPGPQPPLPPMNPDTMSRGDTPIKANGLSDPSLRSAVEPTPDLPPVMHPGADKYMNDANGIQSCKVPSTFHRVSRGLLPGSCKHCLHLPSETCSMCWEEKPGVEKDSVLDDYIPMPGLALQITLRDPLEINMDRSSVETIHLLKTLFVKKRNEVTDDPVSLPPNGPNKDVIVPKRVTSNKDGSTKSTSSYFGFLSPKSKELEKEQINADAFSTNMQPENVQVLGVHLSEVIIRLHAMKEDNSPDDGLSFCYWDFLASCLTIDYQALKSVTKVSQDIRLDAGLFSWDEYCGVKSNRLVSLGIPLYSREENESLSFVSSGRSGLDDQFCNKTTWPSTACALMNIPPPLETLCYKDRKSHGVQMRFISVRNPEIVTEASRSLLNVRLGVTTTRFPWGFWRAINSTRRQITWGILGKPDAKGEEVSLEQTSSESQNASSPTSSIMTYSVQIDGGSIIMDPMIDMNMPLTRFAGERSSEAGISFEAIFDKLQMVYGKKAPGKNKVLSLQQLSVLPENVRTRILFCLDDLRPLEVALDVKKELNPFKRTLAVNKGILKMAKRLTRATRSAARVPQRPSTGARTRREYVMTELMKLDDRELNELWTVHQRHIKKRVKKRGSNDSTPLLGSTS